MKRDDAWLNPGETAALDQYEAEIDRLLNIMGKAAVEGEPDAARRVGDELGAEINAMPEDYAKRLLSVALSMVGGYRWDEGWRPGRSL